MQRVDFHVLPSAETRERLHYACRVVEKAYLAGQRVLVWFDGVVDLQTFDEMLWTYSAGSFVPHEVLAGEPDWEDAPVWLGAAHPAPSACDVLINLAAAIPPAADRAQRVIEIIDADDGRRQAGRARFRGYRERGVEPVTHTIGAAAS